MVQKDRILLINLFLLDGYQDLQHKHESLSLDHRHLYKNWVLGSASETLALDEAETNAVRPVANLAKRMHSRFDERLSQKKKSGKQLRKMSGINQSLHMHVYTCVLTCLHAHMSTNPQGEKQREIYSPQIDVEVQIFSKIFPDFFFFSFSDSKKPL